MKCTFKRDGDPYDVSVKKIPRPPNAFMLYANENRKVMAQLYPTESNKDISKRLGSSWKNLNVYEKNKYFEKAKIIDNEHKKKYPNYVYNPKEARIRKAMREANRERSIGASPVVARNEQQRPQIPASEWPHSNQQQMMMPPMLDIQNPEASCNFSMPNHQNQFNHSIGRYNKLHSSSLMQNSSSIPGYAQPSPLAQLQQQTEMWYNYQENMRPRSIGNSFHMPEMNPYSTHPSDAIMQETPTNLVMRSHSNHSSPCCPLTPAPTSSPTIEKNQSLANRKVNDASQNYASKITEIFEQQKELKKSPSPCATDTDMAFMIDESANGDIKEEDVSNLEKKKQPRCFPCNRHVFLPLSKTNVCAQSDLQLNDEIYQREYISKYFENHAVYKLWEIKTQDGFSFPFATSSPPAFEPSDKFLEVMNFEEGPNWVYTDVGYIPIIENDSNSECNS